MAADGDDQPECRPDGSDEYEPDPLHRRLHESVSGFTSGDISFAGSTAGGTLVATLTEIAPGTTYDVAISGMTTTGFVIAGIPADAATDASNNPNTASTSVDNTVTWQP